MAYYSKPVKVFSKKRDSPVEEVFLDDDDDDDFKLSKNPFPSKAKCLVKEKKLPSEKLKEGKATKTLKKVAAGTVTKFNSDFVSTDCGTHDEKGEIGQLALLSEDKYEKANVGGNSKAEIEEVRLDEQENFEVTLLGEFESSQGSSGFPKNEGKEAWKNLMGEMQRNQKAVVGNGAKKGKPSTKRCLVQSPKPKSTVNRKADQIQSPVKKNARLGSGESVTVSSIGNALKEFKNGTRLASFESQKGSTQSTGLNEASSSSIVNDSTNLVKKIVANASTMVAPVFLPPAERKALQKTSSLKSDTSAKDILESLINSDPDLQLPNNLPDDPTKFNGNNVILNQFQPEKDPYEGKKTKVCPFYKKLPGVPFCVDAFNYGLIPGMEVYFLSHFHSDHYIGLTKKFCKTIICSYPTGNLVRMKLYVEEKCIRKLQMNKPYLICDSEVILVDANHCPGSVMFVFRFKTGKVTLHTGDFRYTPSMLTNPFLSGLLVDDLYLDTTYCSPQYDFPTQNESVATVIAHVKRHLEYRPQTLVLCGSYMIGKERVYFTLAEAIGSKVYGTFDKRKIINALENKKFSDLLSADENLTQIHVVPMFSISAKNLQDYLAKYPQYTNIIGIKPSGWQFSSCGSGCSVKTHYNGTVTVLGIPYSEHSSFSELREFVSNLKPKRVQPTVNVGNPKKRGEMMQHIGSWISV